MSYKFHILYKKIFKSILWYLVLPIFIVGISAPFFLGKLYEFEESILTRDKSETLTSIEKNNDAFKYQYLAVKTFSYEVSAKDYRAVVLEEYFARNNSPLVSESENFINACDKYGAPPDCTTLAAIAYVETGLCTYKPAQQQKNCWGYGGAGENRIWFDSYGAAIDRITERLVNGYGIKYMLDPVSMQYTYCGPNCHSWGKGVQRQRENINRLSVELGYPALF